MQQVFLIFSTFLFVGITAITKGQSVDFLDFTKPQTYLLDAAVFIDDVPCDASYFNEEKPKIMKGMKGTLSLSYITCAKKGSKPVDKIAFQVAIKNKRTGTMHVATEKPVYELNLEDVTGKCEVGDKIIVMPVDQKFALPNNEMVVAGGC